MYLARLRKIVKGERRQEDDAEVMPVKEQKDESSGSEQLEKTNVSDSSRRIEYTVEEENSFTITVNPNCAPKPVPNNIPGQYTAENVIEIEEQPVEIFTDEKSTTGVNNYGFMTAMSLLRGLLEDINLLFRCHGFSNEIMSHGNPAVPRLPHTTTVYPDQALVP